MIGGTGGDVDVVRGVTGDDAMAGEVIDDEAGEIAAGMAGGPADIAGGVGPDAIHDNITPRRPRRIRTASKLNFAAVQEDQG